jgi:hypothetical protein
MSGSRSRAPSVFSPVTVIMLVLVVAFALSAFFVLAAYAPDLQASSSGGSSALSRSAVGFAGMRELLRLRGVPQIVMRRPPPDVPREGGAGLLIVTANSRTRTEAIQGLNFNGPLLIVLPKWSVVPDPDHNGWVRRRDETLPDSIAQQILGGYDRQLALQHGPTTARPMLRMNGQPFARPGPVINLQTLQGEAWTPVVTNQAGRAVLARFAETDVYVLSDPDLLNNHGLRDLDTARTGLAIINLLRDGDGPVMFDVSLLAGVRNQASLLRMLFDPPFLAVTLCLLAAAIFMGINTAVRFGPTQAVSRVFAFGDQALADNTAALVRLAKREAAMAPRYVQVVRGLAAKSLAAPRDLTPQQVGEFLDRMGRQRGVTESLTQLTDAAGQVRNRTDLMSVAQRLHRWRLEMTREHK